MTNFTLAVAAITAALSPAAFLFGAWRSARERAEIAEQSVRNLRGLLAISRDDARRWMDLASKRGMTIELLRGNDFLRGKKP
jgi:hypothetical protein